jgi:hypothetical protein
MFARKTVAAGLVALSALVAVPASAATLGVDFTQRGPVVIFKDGRGYDHDRRYDHGRWDRDRHQARYLSANEVRRILRSRGYRNIDYVDRNGSIYRARAIDYRGRMVALTISARNGVILDSDRLRRG